MTEEERIKIRKEQIKKDVLADPQVQANQRSVAMFTSLCFLLKQKRIVTDKELETLDKKIIPSAMEELNNMLVEEIFKKQGK